MLWLLLITALTQCGPAGCRVIMPPESTSGTQAVSTLFTIELIPPDGRVFFNDQEIPLHGGRAVMQTPPLRPGLYHYLVTARWGDVERRWTVRFEAGQPVTLTLRRDEAQPARDTHETTGKAQILSEREPLNYGIDVDELRKHSRENFTLDGTPLSRTEALAILNQTLQDDSDTLRLTIIGSEEARRRVREDLAGPLADEAREFLIQDYPPDHWAVKDAGFHREGNPTIYIQKPDGTVLHRQDDYNGPDEFRAVLEKLRRPDPNYDPRKDPDLRRQPGQGPLGRLVSNIASLVRSLWGLLLTLLIIALLVILTLKGWTFYWFSLILSLIPAAPAKTYQGDELPRDSSDPQPPRTSAARARTAAARSRKKTQTRTRK